jgi:hypothetical protein
MESVPDLIIPIRMDRGAATAAIGQFGTDAKGKLGQVGDAGKKAGKDTCDQLPFLRR